MVLRDICWCKIDLIMYVGLIKDIDICIILEVDRKLKYVVF